MMVCVPEVANLWATARVDWEEEGIGVGDNQFGEEDQSTTSGASGCQLRANCRGGEC